MADSVKKEMGNLSKGLEETKLPPEYLNIWSQVATILTDVAVATYEEIIGDESKVVNKNVGFFQGFDEVEPGNQKENREAQNTNRNSRNQYQKQSSQYKQPNQKTPENFSTRKEKEEEEEEEEEESDSSSRGPTYLEEEESSAGEDLPFSHKETISIEEHNDPIEETTTK